MRLYLYLWFWLAGTMAVAQDEIISKENVKIPCKIKAVSGQLIYYVGSLNDRPDSIATDAVREFHYKDSLRVLVLPITRKGQLDILTSVEFQDAISNDSYAVLLHGKTTRYDLRFTAPVNAKTAVALTPDTRIKLAPMVTLMKSHPGLSFDISVYSDTTGKAAMNQLATERQAAALRTYLVGSGLPTTNFTVSGRGESESGPNQQLLNRRVEFRCTAVKGIALYYAEQYIPPKRIEPIAQTPIPVQSTQDYTRIQSAIPKNKKAFSIMAYGEGLYALEALSDNWVNPDLGPGILQGFGGGAMFTYYIKPRIGLTAQIGYSQWAVRRRYLTADGVVQYTNDQTVDRLVLQIGAKLYITPGIYFQPTVGGQQLALTSQNSATHPDGVNKSKTTKLLPTAGGAIGFEFTREKLIIDIAAQYYFIPNKTFATITQPLQFVGLRLGAGYRSHKP